MHTSTNSANVCRFLPSLNEWLSPRLNWKGNNLIALQESLISTRLTVIVCQHHPQHHQYWQMEGPYVGDSTWYDPWYIHIFHNTSDTVLWLYFFNIWTQNHYSPIYMYTFNYRTLSLVVLSGRYINRSVLYPMVRSEWNLHYYVWMCYWI